MNYRPTPTQGSTVDIPTDIDGHELDVLTPEPEVGTQEPTHLAD